MAIATDVGSILRHGFALHLLNLELRNCYSDSSFLEDKVIILIDICVKK